MNWQDILIDAAATDTGMRRSNNQDRFAIVRAKTPEAWKKRGHVFMVADGMGAHAVGELASKLACDNIPHNFAKMKVESTAEALTKAYREVANIIHAKANANKDFQGMGTTCSTLVLGPDGALIAHVGDSRVYRIRGGTIDQLTFDHSLVWELIRRNHLPPEHAQKAVPRNVITRSLGPDPNIEVDIEGPHPVESGDVYLLCSDGLSGPIEDPELGAFASQFHPDTASKYLLHLANLRGGHDNITVMIVRVGPWDDPDDPNLSVLEPGASVGASSAKGKGFSLASLRNAFQRKPPSEPVEEHIYRTAPCPIDDALLNRLSEDLRSAQALAVEQAWPIDWATLTALREDAKAARSAGDRRKALRMIGEIILRLGVAGRVHRKEHGPIGAH
ncbi:PP2C family protein-serine/threonine phosphatase [Tautonia sociabilis]|uniref:Serine/threonine-protein phosphatase n=1 Tax=Tautonia sociabilis TaxID=2080755 RepID=A0A432MIX6_9BACT|nr:protein phosphatase 2C domain-containing protein [Tautonia sociabilis]RUL87155.1 serine/threonine-protein phosphatase [Tautonia sociabilis]